MKEPYRKGEKIHPDLESAGHIARRLAQTDARILHFDVGPSNDHELAITRIVDQLDIEGRLSLPAIQEAVAVLAFKMTGSDAAKRTAAISSYLVAWHAPRRYRLDSEPIPILGH